MKAEAFRTNEHRLLVDHWWKFYHDASLRPEWHSLYGIQVLEKSVPLAFAYLYPSVGSDVIHLAFIVRSPKLSPFRAGKAVKLLVEEALREAKRMGYGLLYSASESRSVHKLLTSAGFKPGKYASQEFVKEI